MQEPPEHDKFLQAVQMVSVFGGSITFTLIVGSNAPPTRRFTDQIVRDLLSAAWLCFFLALAAATIGRIGYTKESNLMQRPGLKQLRMYRNRIIAGFINFAFVLLSVAVLAYSDVGWAAVGITSVGCVFTLMVGYERNRPGRIP